MATETGKMAIALLPDRSASETMNENSVEIVDGRLVIKDVLSNDVVDVLHRRSEVTDHSKHPYTKFDWSRDKHSCLSCLLSR